MGLAGQLMQANMRWRALWAMEHQTSFQIRDVTRKLNELKKPAKINDGSQMGFAEELERLLAKTLELKEEVEKNAEGMDEAYQMGNEYLVDWHKNRSSELFQSGQVAATKISELRGEYNKKYSKTCLENMESN